MIPMRSLLFLLFVEACLPCPEKWSRLTDKRCVRYFESPLNFSEAQGVCQQIYDGQLVKIDSSEEQKRLVQYLHETVGLVKTPVAWIGASINPPDSVRWTDGERLQYQNFAGRLNTQKRSCVKIFSLLAQGSKGSPGQWGLDACDLRDSGFVCEIPETVVRPQADESRSRTIVRSSTPSTKAAELKERYTPGGNVLLDQFGEQLSAIKELCETQIRAIELLSNNFLAILEKHEQQSNRNVNL